MKQTKVKVVSPILNGAVVARGSIALGMGHECRYEIIYDGPSQPMPSQGIAWPPELDWPAAQMTVTLPGGEEREAATVEWRPNPTGDVAFYRANRLAPDLRCAAVVAGETLAGETLNWGLGSQPIALARADIRRSRYVRRIGTSLRAVAAELLRELRAELRPVQAHLAARASRIAQREATLTLGQDMRALVCDAH